ncbi:hypothetical protein ACFXD5_42410 [Streptomyces sp. NPDC059385]|uniref:hypothetical protein n=1 Tax=Streptomyces sp. NPDC059385 TaxID=3346817 RepID=UPI0036CB7198
MTPSSRRLSVALLGLCAAVATGCAAPGGLGPAAPAPPVSMQPRPEPLWPAWTAAPGAAVGRPEPPPTPLKNAPVPGAGGLAAVDPKQIAAADPRMKPYLCNPGTIRAPGRAGVRPPVHKDLTGDGQPDLIVAADMPTGRSALSVYTISGGKIVSVLFTIGRQLTAESIGSDLLVRTAVDDGSEQAVRYHWDGGRMTVVNDERTFRKPDSNCSPSPGRSAQDAR